MCKINDVALMSRLIINKSSQLDTPELKKMFIIAMASVPEPSQKEKELALKEIEKPYDKRDMQKIISNNRIKINKQEFFKLLKLNYEKDGTIYNRYRRLFDKLVKSTHYDFDKDDDFMSGFFFTKVVAYGNYFTITVDPDFMPIFWSLKGGYVKLLTEDVAGFDSKFTMDLYKFLMGMNNYKEVNLTTKQLKMIFGLSENDYMKNNHRFDRYNFEKYTLNRALKELDEKCKSITIIKQIDENNKTVDFLKVKENKKVKYYNIKYFVTDPYQIVNQEKQTQTTIDDFMSDQEFPRSRTKSGRLQRSRHIQLQRIEEINQNLYNWLEE